MRRKSWFQSMTGNSMRFASLNGIAIRIVLVLMVTTALYTSFAAPREIFAAIPSWRSHGNSTAGRSRPVRIEPHPGIEGLAAAGRPARQEQGGKNNRPSFRQPYKTAELGISMREYLSRIPLPDAEGNRSLALEVYWANEDQEKRICRIHNACLNPDGSILIHPKLAGHEDLLAACYVKNVTYMNSTDELRPKNYSAVDLFGHLPARDHMPHFMTDVLPMIYFSELMRPSETREFMRICVGADEAPCPNGVLTERLNAALFASDPVLDMQLSRWVPQFAGLLPFRPRIITPEQGFNEGPACFRSVIPYKVNDHLRRGKGWYGQSRMFLGNGLRKRENLSEGCDNLQITVLDRGSRKKRDDLRVVTARDIVNVDELVAAVEKHARVSNVSVSVSVVYFEKATFSEQVELMQNTDILIGAHGAALANMIFLREQIPFLEVVPFCYLAGPFDAVAKTMELRYARIVAEPDVETFDTCMEEHGRRHKDMAAATRGIGIWKYAILREREDGVRGYLQCNRMSNPRMAKEYRFMNNCARRQRLKMDVEHAAKIVMEMAAEVCPAS